MRYKTTPPPINVHNLEGILAWIYQELSEIEVTLDNLESSRINLVVQHSEPERPREGDIVRADGTDWNPGSGEGVYEYTSGGAWSKL